MNVSNEWVNGEWGVDQNLKESNKREMKGVIGINDRRLVYIRKLASFVATNQRLCYSSLLSSCLEWFKCKRS